MLHLPKPSSSPSYLSQLNLLPLPDIPVILWQQLLHALMPLLLLDVRQQALAPSPHQPMYPVHVIRSLSCVACHVTSIGRVANE